MQQAGIWRGGHWGRPPASAPAPCRACTPTHTPAPSPHLQNGDSGVISRLREMIFVKEPGWSLTSIKQFTLLSCHDSREQDSPVGQTGVPGGPLPLARGITLTLRLLITICSVAMSFASCISLYLHQKRMNTPLFQEEPSLRQGEAGKQPVWTEEGAHSKSPSPWLNPPFSSPAAQFCPAMGTLSPNRPGLGYTNQEPVVQ